MNAKKRSILVIALGLVLAALRTVIVIYNMEQKTPNCNVYYMPDNTYVTVFTAAIVLALALVCFVAVSSGKKKTVTLDDKNASVSVGSLVLAFALIGTVLVYCINHIDTEKTPTYIGAFVMIFSVCSAVKFLMSGLKGNTSGNEALAGVALFPILLTVFRLLGDFIRTGANPMASSGAYHIVGLAAVLIYFLCEGKAYLSDCSAAMYNLSAGIAVVMLLVYSVPNVILHCFGMLSFNYYAAFSVADIAAAIYITTRTSCAEYKTRVVEAVPEEIFENSPEIASETEETPTEE